MDNSNQTELKQLFFSQGDLFEVPLNHRFTLNNESQILLLVDGDLDLYLEIAKDSKQLEGQIPANSIGTITFLQNISSGRCLFPFPSNHAQVICQATTHSKIFSLPIANLVRFLFEHPENIQEFTSWMKNWILDLSFQFNKFTISQVTHHLQTEGRASFPKNSIIALSHSKKREEISWISISNGKVAILGVDQIILEASEKIYPFPNLLWLKGLAETTTIEIIQDEYTPGTHEKFWKGLVDFNRSIVKIAAYNIQQQNLKEQEHFSQMISKENQFLDNSFREMNRVLSEENVSISHTSHKPLIEACLIIGKIIQQTFVEKVPSQARTLSEKIYEICTTSNVNYRPVLLTQKWWEQDHGLLLGFYKNSADTENEYQPLSHKKIHPFVLESSSNGQYRMIDPSTGTTQKIEETIAERIDPHANMFYRAFPSKSHLSRKDIINYCLHGRLQDFLIIFFVGILAVILALYMPFANQIIFDEVIPYLDVNSFIQILIGLVIMFLCTSLFSITREYAVLRAESYLKHDVEMALWERLLILPIHFFNRYTVGDLLLRISSVKEIRTLITSQAIRISINGVFSIIFVLAMLYYSPILTLIGIGIVFFGFLVSAIGFAISQKLELVNQNIKGRMNGKVVQMILGLSKIRIYGAENFVFSSWCKDLIENQKLRLRIGLANIFVKVTNNTLELLKYLIIFLAIIYLFHRENASKELFAITIGSYLAFNVAFLSFSTALSELSTTMMDMISVYPLWQRSKVILQEAPETSSERIKTDVLKGELRIEHLHFRYSLHNHLIYKDLSMHILPGEFIAIVGPSGCGKSTLVRLLIGFENPEQGTVSFDGKDLMTLDLKSVRSNMSIILQNSTILDGTLFDNITAGSLASESEVMEAVKLSGLIHDFAQFPMGLNTLLTTGGITLSGGQRQKILIARAFLAKAPIMIWDEATNNLDNQSQDLVIDNLEKLNVTRIVVAQRLNTIRHADRIYVIDQGQIVDSGTFKELSERPGIFSTMNLLT